MALLWGLIVPLSCEEVLFEGLYRCPDAVFGEFSASFWCPSISALPVPDMGGSAWLCFGPLFLRALCRFFLEFEFASSIWDSISINESIGFVGGSSCGGETGSAGPPPLTSDLSEVWSEDQDCCRDRANMPAARRVGLVE